MLMLMQIDIVSLHTQTLPLMSSIAPPLLVHAPSSFAAAKNHQPPLTLTLRQDDASVSNKEARCRGRHGANSRHHGGSPRRGRRFSATYYASIKIE